ncbi:hypothetical protein GCM10023314_04180 [Algibacter agarivorans]|uniref:Uncharacterized protein n=1 Tax=Algibacter agarivorans TaxID=1109741 RepID=A0ABP9GA57_9FLAO
MWHDNPTFKKIDARLQISDTISKRWLKETNKDKFIKSTLELYDRLYNNE